MASKKLRTPIWWFGGKGQMVEKLLDLYYQMPKHQTYIEVFGGSGALLFGKVPVGIEIYNDLDSNLVSFFRVLRDKEQFAELHRLCQLTPYSREEYNHCRATWRDQVDPVIRAYKWYIMTRWSFSAKGGWSYAKCDKAKKGMSGSVSSWLSIVELLPRIHKRFMRVQVEHLDFEALIRKYDAEYAFFYLDPPYIPDTRSDGGYAHELTMEDHQRLVDILLSMQGNAMLSGYDHPVYEPLEQAGWQVKRFEVSCRVDKIPQKRVECVWYKQTIQQRLF